MPQDRPTQERLQSEREILRQRLREVEARLGEAAPPPPGEGLGEDRFQALFHQVPLEIYAWRAKGDDFVLEDYNQAAEEASRGKLSHLKGAWLSQTHADQPQIIADMRACLQRRETLRRELRDYPRRSDASLIDTEITYAFVPPDLVLVQVLDVTRPLRDRAALAQERGRLRSLIENLNDVTFTLDPQGLFTYISPVAEARSGYKPSEVLGRHFLEFIAPEDQERMAAAVAGVFSGKPAQAEFRLLTKGGEPRWALGSARALLQDGRPVELNGIWTDISDRKRAEEALARSERRFRTAFADSAMGMALADREGKIVEANAAFAAMLGYSPEEMKGRHFLDITHPDDSNLSLANYQEALNKREGAYRLEKRYLHRSGKTIWARMTLSVLPGPPGEPGMALAQVEDITLSKAMEDALEASERRFRSAFESSGVGMALVDASGRFLSVNQAVLDILGYSRAEFDQLKYTEITHPDDLKMSLAKFQEVMARGEGVYKLEKRYLHKSGRAIWGRLTLALVRDQPGAAPYAIAQLEDITAQKEAEAALSERQAHLEIAQELAQVGSFAWDPADDSLTWSENMYAMAGLDPDLDLGRLQEVIQGLIHPEDREWVQGEIARMLDQGQTWPMEFRVIRPDGQERIWRSASVFLKDDAGRLLKSIGMHRDLTEERRAAREREHLESELRQAQKMEAIGTLAGGIAHDFNNILGAILGYTELCQEMGKEGLNHSYELEKIVEACGRARDLVRQILTFSRKVATRRLPVDLNREIDQICQLLMSTLARDIRVETDLEPNLPAMEADPVQVGQVLLNLATNAADAMPQGGRLVFSTRRVDLDRDAAAEANLTPGPYLELTVSDTGQGMDPAILSQAFDPFFTTKGPGKGTGMGLSTVYGIIKGHRGAIAAHSTAGQGSRFTLHWPAEPAAAQRAPAPSQTAPSLSDRPRRLLLVEDEPMLRETAAAILDRAGYRVDTAASGEEALEVFGRSLPRPDLVILDLGMPGMGGLACLKALRVKAPRARVIIATGYGDEGKLNQAVQAGALGSVAKPFRRSELLAAVAGALAKPA